MSLQREIIVFLVLMIVGGMFYIGFGEWARRISDERVTYWMRDKSNLGLDYWIITRIHLFGLFASSLGAIGLLVKMRQANLIE